MKTVYRWLINASITIILGAIIVAIVLLRLNPGCELQNLSQTKLQELADEPVWNDLEPINSSDDSFRIKIIAYLEYNTIDYENTKDDDHDDKQIDSKHAMTSNSIAVQSDMARNNMSRMSTTTDQQQQQQPQQQSGLLRQSFVRKPDALTSAQSLQLERSPVQVIDDGTVGLQQGVLADQPVTAPPSQVTNPPSSSMTSTITGGRIFSPLYGEIDRSKSNPPNPDNPLMTQQQSISTVKPQINKQLLPGGPAKASGLDRFWPDLLMELLSSNSAKNQQQPHQHPPQKQQQQPGRPLKTNSNQRVAVGSSAEWPQMPNRVLSTIPTRPVVGFPTTSSPVSTTTTTTSTSTTNVPSPIGTAINPMSPFGDLTQSEATVAPASPIEPDWMTDFLDHPDQPMPSDASLIVSTTISPLTPGLLPPPTRSSLSNFWLPFIQKLSPTLYPKIQIKSTTLNPAIPSSSDQALAPAVITQPSSYPAIRSTEAPPSTFYPSLYDQTRSLTTTWEPMLPPIKTNDDKFSTVFNQNQIVNSGNETTLRNLQQMTAAPNNSIVDPVLESTQPLETTDSFSSQKRQESKSRRFLPIELVEVKGKKLNATEYQYKFKFNCAILSMTMVRQPKRLFVREMKLKLTTWSKKKKYCQLALPNDNAFEIPLASNTLEPELSTEYQCMKSNLLRFKCFHTEPINNNNNNSANNKSVGKLLLAHLQIQKLQFWTKTDLGLQNESYKMNTNSTRAHECLAN